MKSDKGAGEPLLGLKAVHLQLSEGGASANSSHSVFWPSLKHPCRKCSLVPSRHCLLRKESCIFPADEKLTPQGKRLRIHFRIFPLLLSIVSLDITVNIRLDGACWSACHDWWTSCGVPKPESGQRWGCPPEKAPRFSVGSSWPAAPRALWWLFPARDSVNMGGMWL